MTIAGYRVANEMKSLAARSVEGVAEVERCLTGARDAADENDDAVTALRAAVEQGMIFVRFCTKIAAGTGPKPKETEAE